LIKKVDQIGVFNDYLIDNGFVDKKKEKVNGEKISDSSIRSKVVQLILQPTQIDLINKINQRLENIDKCLDKKIEMPDTKRIWRHF